MRRRPPADAGFLVPSLSPSPARCRLVMLVSRKGFETARSDLEKAIKA